MRHAIIGTVILGALIGLLFSSLFSPNVDESGECERLEDSIRKNQTFNGSLQCYPPGVIEVNLTEEIENSTELQCVCRNTYLGSERIFPITRAQTG